MNAPRLSATLTLICLLMAGCGDQSAGNGNSNDAVIKQSQVLEKRANDQVNETIATIESESRDAIKEQAPPPPENATSLSSGNQN